MRSEENIIKIKSFIERHKEPIVVLSVAVIIVFGSTFVSEQFNNKSGLAAIGSLFFPSGTGSTTNNGMQRNFNNNSQPSQHAQPETTAQSTDVQGVSAFLSANIDNFDPNILVGNIEEDSTDYYVHYNISKWEIVDNAWQLVRGDDVLLVDKTLLGDQDLGLFVSGKLADIAAEDIALAKRSQNSAQTSSTPVPDSLYASLVGKRLNLGSRALDGYSQVVFPRTRNILVTRIADKLKNDQSATSTDQDPTQPNDNSIPPIDTTVASTTSTSTEEVATRTPDSGGSTGSASTTTDNSGSTGTTTPETPPGNSDNTTGTSTADSNQAQNNISATSSVDTNPPESSTAPSSEIATPSQDTGTTTSLVLGISSFKFNRNLSVGSVGSDVIELQKFLNSFGFIVAQSGQGSYGHEIDTFGNGTKRALSEFQAIVGISPSGLFGPITRQYVNDMFYSFQI